MAEPSLNFGVLGPLLTTVDGTSVALGAPKQTGRTGDAGDQQNHPVGTDSLINAVWGESPVPAARTSIHSHVSTLRRLLDEAGTDARRVLIKASPGYQLNVADADCDLGPVHLREIPGSCGRRRSEFRTGEQTPVRCAGPSGAERFSPICATSRSSIRSPPP